MEDMNYNPHTITKKKYPKINLLMAQIIYLRKTMECMVKKCLVWFNESNNLLTNSQCGSRTQISTVDYVVRLSISIREANIQKQHSIDVFFLDHMKTYKTTRTYTFYEKPIHFGRQGRLTNFILNFLLKRKIHVHIRSTLSNAHNQD